MLDGSDHSKSKMVQSSSSLAAVAFLLSSARMLADTFCFLLLSFAAWPWASDHP
jgi:hypothetical protein